MKVATIEAYFPELRGKYMWRSGQGTGSTTHAAISRAMREVLKGVKGRRFTAIKLTVSVQTVATVATVKN